MVCKYSGLHGLTTSDFLTQQATLRSQDATWIAGLNATRLDFGTAQDLLGIQVLTALCESRQYTALLQTLLFEVGFQLDNVIPEWFRIRASKILAGQEWLHSNVFCQWYSLSDISSRRESTTKSEQTREQWSPETLSTC
ncbi:hypothetical protein PHMEG_0002755 [Phytophthora megakarya]|uniref:Uncharacterized protein n=1 Tax=Phytophthora megakarya TaxID=4795 RepID=A0A225WZT7_9STRA|nr:hypothetical protein PHMEG_0002755 [Phytophthora megakarya]